MLFKNSYYQLEKPSKGIYKSKGSKFIAYAFIVKNEQEVNQNLINIKKIENSARHHCFAYILNPDKSATKASDDGEPSNTAGKPILGQINSNDLTNILIIVVRYFGGIKLGISGLIKAYKSASNDAINNNKIIIKNIVEEYNISFDFEETNFVMKICKKFKVKIINNTYKDFCEVKYHVKKDDADLTRSELLRNHKIKVKFIKTIQ